MLVVDSSAIVAILEKEPLAGPLVACIVAASSRLIAAANYVEVGTVLAGRRIDDRARTVADLDDFLSDSDIDIAPVTAEHARAALIARTRFGKGFGSRRGLNFGDCFAYALAVAHDAPLLFVGEDFAATDVKRAIG